VKFTHSRNLTYGLVKKKKRLEISIFFWLEINYIRFEIVSSKMTYFNRNIFRNNENTSTSGISFFPFSAAIRAQLQEKRLRVKSSGNGAVTSVFRRRRRFPFQPHCVLASPSNSFTNEALCQSVISCINWEFEVSLQRRKMA